MWCTLLCYSISGHIQSAKCIFIGFEHGFCIDIDMKILSLKVFIFKCDMFANKINLMKFCS